MEINVKEVLLGALAFCLLEPLVKYLGTWMKSKAKKILKAE